MRKLLLLVVEQRDSDRETRRNRGRNNERKRGRGRILTEGLRIRRHPCRVVGDGSNRDQLVCKSHVNIAHSPGTEVSEASRSISRSLDTSFSLVSTALVRFYPTPSVSPLPSLSRSRSTEEKKSKPGQSKRGRGRDGILPHSSSVRFQPLVEVECRRTLYWYSSFSTRPDTGEFTRHRMSLAFNMRTMIKI